MRGRAHAIVIAAGGRADRLEQADRIHHDQALGVAGASTADGEMQKRWLGV